MSNPISFRHVPRVRQGRPAHWLHVETGIEIWKGYDTEFGIEWQVWTAGMGKPLGTARSLNEAKALARWIITARKEWLA